MREIKFRAWDAEEKILYTAVPIHAVRVGDWLEFGGSTLKFMQYTGIKDKNGKEIYEGDVLTSDKYPFQGEGGNNYLAEVIFEDGGFHAVLCLTPEGKERVNGIAEGNSSSGEGMSKLEIIGNIYENPELIAPPEA